VRKVDMNTDADMGLTACAFAIGRWAANLSFWWIMRDSI